MTEDCARGHPAAGNRYVGSTGKSRCRACSRENHDKWRRSHGVMPKEEYVHTEPLSRVMKGREIDIAPLARRYSERFGVPERKAHSAFEAVLYDKKAKIHEETADRLCAVIGVPFRWVYPDGGLTRREAT